MANGKLKGFDVLFLTLLMCFAVALFNLSGYIYCVLVAIAFVAYGGKIKISATSMGLMAFSVCYFLFYTLNYEFSVETLILYLIGPWTAHIIGKIFVGGSNSQHAFIYLIVVLSVGMFAHGMLNILAYVRSEHYLQYNYYRQAVDFWRNELVNVKTTEMLYTFATGMSLGVLFTAYKRKYKILSIFILAGSLFATIFMANRALLIVFVGLFVWRLFCWYTDRRVSFDKKAVSFILSVFVVLTVSILISANVNGIGDTIMHMKIVQRFISGEELTRLDVWSVFFEDLRFLKYPIGGKMITQNSEWDYLHNMWLDAYNVTGFLPASILLLLTIGFAGSFSRFNKVMKRANKENERIVFQSLAIAFFLNMMIEPIIEANPYYLLMVFMFMGAMEMYTYKTRNENIES